MPPKQNQVTLIRRMDTKVAALEEDMVSVKEDVAGVRTTLAAMEKNEEILF
jgi:hypothetical protein